MTVVDHGVRSRSFGSLSGMYGPVADRRSSSVQARPTTAPSASLTAPSLSKREVEVLLAWLRADSKGEAAEELFVSPSTVNTHLTRIRAKYAAVGREANSKASLFVRALQDELTSIDQW